MRNTFVDALTRLAAEDPRAMLIVGDLGFSVVEGFAKAYPERFLNAGIAEQNMAGLAAGLASVGYHPFLYSIANFPTLRCLEQIRNDIVYHRRSVTVAAVGAGLAYGSLGYSHHAVQDIACLRSLPGILMATPGDPFETVAVTRALLEAGRPSYLRLGKGGEAQVNPGVPEGLQPGIRVVRPGGRVAVLACGSVLPLCAQAAEATGATLLSCPLWDGAPATRVAMLDHLEGYERVVVVEEHLAAGGFGSFLRESAESRPHLQARLRCVALDEAVCGMVGTADDLREAGGLTVARVTGEVRA